MKTINGKDIKGEGNIIVNEGVPTIKTGTGNYSEIFNYNDNNEYISKANGEYSHAEGAMTKANKYASHSEGWYTIANGICCHVEGLFNTGQEDSIHEVGIGTDTVARKDANRITTDGRHYILNIGGFDGSKATADFTTEKDLATIINDFETRIAALEAKQTT